MRKSPELLSVHYTKENAFARVEKKETTNVDSSRLAQLNNGIKKGKGKNTKQIPVTCGQQEFCEENSKLFIKGSTGVSSIIAFNTITVDYPGTSVLELVPMTLAYESGLVGLSMLETTE